MPSRTVVIFAYDGAQLIDIAGPTQALTTANEEGALPPYAVRLVAVSGGPIRTASGVKLIADPLPRAITIDTLLVPGGPGVHTFRKDRGALAALQRLCIAKLFGGYRGKPAADVDALIGTILGVARYASENLSVLVELDVNPVIVRPAGLGAVAVDTMIRLRGPLKE